VLVARILIDDDHTQVPSYHPTPPVRSPATHDDDDDDDQALNDRTGRLQTNRRALPRDKATPNRWAINAPPWVIGRNDERSLRYCCWLISSSVGGHHSGQLRWLPTAAWVARGRSDADQVARLVLADRKPSNLPTIVLIGFWSAPAHPDHENRRAAGYWRSPLAAKYYGTSEVCEVVPTLLGTPIFRRADHRGTEEVKGVVEVPDKERIGKSASDDC